MLRGCPPTEACFSQINFLGGHPEGGSGGPDAYLRVLDCKQARPGRSEGETSPLEISLCLVMDYENPSPFIHFSFLSLVHIIFSYSQTKTNSPGYITCKPSRQSKPFSPTGLPPLSLTQLSHLKREESGAQERYGQTSTTARACRRKAVGPRIRLPRTNGRGWTPGPSLIAWTQTTTAH